MKKLENNFDNNKDSVKVWYEAARANAKAKLNITNGMAVPRIAKIVVNTGLKEAVSNSKIVAVASNVMSAVTGQKPVKAIARKSIAGFKIREGMPIGVFVTLRGKNMLHFLSKLINLSLPRIRDFQGVSRKLDGQGNYNLGIKDITVFPEAEAAGGADLSSGVNITIVTTASEDSQASVLLECLGMPFYRK
jgi:large subunit ribosomal protein L5